MWTQLGGVQSKALATLFELYRPLFGEYRCSSEEVRVRCFAG